MYNIDTKQAEPVNDQYDFRIQFTVTRDTEEVSYAPWDTDKIFLFKKYDGEYVFNNVCSVTDLEDYPDAEGEDYCRKNIADVIVRPRDFLSVVKDLVLNDIAGLEMNIEDLLESGYDGTIT